MVKISEQGKWMVIVNPNAGNRKSAKDWNKITHLLNDFHIEFDFSFTAHKEHAIALTKLFTRDGYRKFIIVGGDGTLNEVMNAIFLQNEIPSPDFLLAVIPIGTGNDWCRTFSVPFSYEGAIKIIKDERTFLQDVGVVSYYQSSELKKRYFMNVAGMGYDAIVASKTNKDKEKGKGGPWLYLKNLFTSLVSYRFTSTEILAGAASTPKINKTFSMSVGICRFNGGGMKQLPFAIPDDGLLDLTLIKRLGKMSVLKEVKNLYDGSFINHPKVETMVSDSFRIKSDPPIFLEADGESLGHSPFIFEIIPRSLRVVAGTTNF
ncbi:MAG: diacylglycerol kinase family lipid kinase [Bacteroidetes bacterium]|nr:diacylglycerol kinase family lipid kinase [Bacteroidota bacterium]